MAAGTIRWDRESPASPAITGSDQPNNHAAVRTKRIVGMLGQTGSHGKHHLRPALVQPPVIA